MALICNPDCGVITAQGGIENEGLSWRLYQEQKWRFDMVLTQAEHMKTNGYLGRIDKPFGVPATTRNWNTILGVVRILKGRKTLLPRQND